MVRTFRLPTSDRGGQVGCEQPGPPQDFLKRCARRERGFLSPEESEVSVEILKIDYALDGSAAVLLNTHRSRPIPAPGHVWWTANSLKRHGCGAIDWRLYTSGTVTEYTVAGEYLEAVQSLHVHQRIGEILDGLHAPTPPSTLRILPS
jgi:hypothetical protein